MITKVNKHLTISEIIEICPDAMDILLEYGLHCVGCGAAMWETLEEGSISHGMDTEMIDDMVNEINEVLSQEHEKEAAAIAQAKIEMGVEEEVSKPAALKNTKGFS